MKGTFCPMMPTPYPKRTSRRFASAGSAIRLPNARFVWNSLKKTRWSASSPARTSFITNAWNPGSVNRPAALCVEWTWRSISTQPSQKKSNRFSVNLPKTETPCLTPLSSSLESWLPSDRWDLQEEGKFGLLTADPTSSHLKREQPPGRTEAGRYIH